MRSFLLLLWFLLKPGVVWCLRLTELQVPTHRVVGEDVKLTCRFEMDGEKLYSVKWYRNEQEFYRFVPNDRPKLQIFPQEGIQVERATSSKHYVTLKHLQLEATGTYRCEVSAEAPSFRTKHAEEAMVVVQTPSQVRIDGAHPKYYLGELVNVTCISDNSSPPAELTWKVNGVPVEEEHKQSKKSSRSRTYQLSSPGYEHYDRIEYDNAGPYDKYRARAREDKGRRGDKYTVGKRGDTYKGIYVREEVIPDKPLGVRLKSDVRQGTPGSNLDTASLNMQFRIDEQRISEWESEGLQLECVASIGAVYWHVTTEKCQVSEKEKEMPWIFSRASGSGCSINTLTGFVILANILVYKAWN